MLEINMLKKENFRGKFQKRQKLFYPGFIMAAECNSR